MTRISDWRQPWGSKWTGQSPMQVFLLSALLGRHLAWNPGARSVILWIMVQSSAHMLPPNPSGLNFPLHGSRFKKTQLVTISKLMVGANMVRAAVLIIMPDMQWEAHSIKLHDEKQSAR